MTTETEGRDEAITRSSSRLSSSQLGHLDDLLCCNQFALLGRLLKRFDLVEVHVAVYLRRHRIDFRGVLHVFRRGWQATQNAPHRSQLCRR